MADIILLTIIFLLELLLFYFLPTLDGQQTLFGIVLKNDDFQTYGLPILRKYRRDFFIIAFVSICGLLLIGKFSPNSLLIAYISATLGIIFPLFKYLGETWKLRDKSTMSRLASPLNPRHLRDFTNFGVELAVIVLVIAPFAVLIFYYPSLPDVVPIHWNAAGEADGWAKKDFSSVFFLPILATFLQIFWIILKQDIIKARFRVPAELAEKILSLKEISLQANVGMVDWCRLVCGILLGTVALLVLSTIAPPPVAATLNIFTWVSLAILLSGMAFYLYRMILVNREIKALTGQITFQTAAEMEGWTDGLFYYNPQDAAFMIEKPGGVGYTMNFAHKRALLYLALIMLPVILSIFNLILMKSQ
jgi:uncharacterized membrane protein